LSVVLGSWTTMVLSNGLDEPVTFRVRVPQDTPPADTVFLAGDFQGWNPHDASYALHREHDGRWAIRFAMSTNSAMEFKFTLGGQGGGGGAAHAASVRDSLRPEIDRRYRTLPDPEHTWMAGSSLGGLISAYAGYHEAATFGRVACVSPSLWWDDRHLLREAE